MRLLNGNGLVLGLAVELANKLVQHVLWKNLPGDNLGGLGLMIDPNA